MNNYKLYALLFLVFYGNQTMCFASSKYSVSRDELASICASFTIANFPIDIETLRSFPMEDNLMDEVNSLIIGFWELYEKHENETTVPKKEYADQLLAQMHIDMVHGIQQIDSKDFYLKSLSYIMWGYALLVIHYQIVHTIT